MGKIIKKGNVKHGERRNGSGMIFSGSGSYFQLVSDPDSISDPTLIFSNILNINFTFVFPCRKCVRLHIIFLGIIFFLQIGIDFFPDPYPDPSNNFGSDRIRIHKTGYNKNRRGKRRVKRVRGRVNKRYRTREKRRKRYRYLTLRVGT
jgi:hypothetical protein